MPLNTRRRLPSCCSVEMSQHLGAVRVPMQRDLSVGESAAVVVRALLLLWQGSSEGVLPDGAGDPLGYLPKGLRQKMKAPEPPSTTPSPTRGICVQWRLL